MHAMTMPVAKAAILAEESGIEELVAAVLSAIEAGWEVVDFEPTADGNVIVSPHTGVMVAWMLPDYLAESLRVDGGEQDLHVTLAYLGDVDDLTLEQQRLLVGIVSEAVQGHHALYGVAAGTSTFPVKNDGDPMPWFAEVDIPGLDELRADIMDKLKDAGLPVHNDFPDFHPHITLAYIEQRTDTAMEDYELPRLTLEPLTLTVDSVTVCIAGSRRSLQLDPQPEDEDYWNEREEWMRGKLGGDSWGAYARSAYRPFVKSQELAEKRFTLAPWYIPDMEDSHGEWTDADELQQAAWDYVDSGYRGIHIQHMPEVVAGRWVEIMTLPHETTWPVIDPNGLVIAHTYPAGTVMLGVIWDQWAWELVKSGKITGYSIGGNAFRTDEAPPGPAQHHELEPAD